MDSAGLATARIAARRYSRPVAPLALKLFGNAPIIRITTTVGTVRRTASYARTVIAGLAILAPLTGRSALTAIKVGHVCEAHAVLATTRADLFARFALPLPTELPLSRAVLARCAARDIFRRGVAPAVDAASVAGLFAARFALPLNADAFTVGTVLLLPAVYHYCPYACGTFAVLAAGVRASSRLTTVKRIAAAAGARGAPAPSARSVGRVAHFAGSATHADHTIASTAKRVVAQDTAPALVVAASAAVLIRYGNDMRAFVACVEINQLGEELPVDRFFGSTD